MKIGFKAMAVANMLSNTSKLACTVSPQLPARKPNFKSCLATAFMKISVSFSFLGVQISTPSYPSSLVFLQKASMVPCQPQLVAKMVKSKALIVWVTSGARVAVEHPLSSNPPLVREDCFRKFLRLILVGLFI